MNIKGVILPWMQVLLLFSESKKSAVSTLPWGQTAVLEVSAGAGCPDTAPATAGSCSCCCSFPKLPHKSKPSLFLVLRLLCIGRVTTFHLLVKGRGEATDAQTKSLHAASPRLIPDGFAVSLPIFAASEFLNSLKVCRRRISTLHIPSRASSVSKSVGKAPSLSLLLHKSSLPKQNPPTKLMVCLHRPNSQPGKLEGSIPSKDHWYVGASSA